MPSEKVTVWIRKAENDLLAVDNNLASAKIPFDVVCYHCQQAAESTSRRYSCFSVLNHLGRMISWPFFRNQGPI